MSETNAYTYVHLIYTHAYMYIAQSLTSSQSSSTEGMYSGRRGSFPAGLGDWGCGCALCPCCGCPCPCAVRLLFGVNVLVDLIGQTNQDNTALHAFHSVNPCTHTYAPVVREKARVDHVPHVRVQLQLRHRHAP